MVFNRPAALRDLALCKVRPQSRRDPMSARSGGLTQHVVLAHLVARANDDGCCTIGIRELNEATDVGEAAGRRALRALTLAGLLEVATTAPGDKVTYRILVLGRETAESGEAVAAE